MSLTVVLDVSAVRSYARLDNVSVGELIATVGEDGDTVGLPVLVLVDVWPDLDATEHAIVGELVTREDGPVVVLPLLVEGAAAVAAHVRRIGHGDAQASAAVVDLAATLATFTPDAYAGVLDPDDVLPLS